MVVGNGLIARAFSSFESNEDFIFFASGVSNSSQPLAEDCKRELDLLLSFKDSNQHLVYFSTSSIHDPSLKKAPYIIHKLNIENLIQSNFPAYTIIRLPNVVGNSANPHTLANNIFSHFKENKKFTVFQKAYRYFIDIEDVRQLVSKYFEQIPRENSIKELVGLHNYSALEVIRIFEEILEHKLDKTELDKGSNYKVIPDEHFTQLAEYTPLEAKNYLYTVLKKYYQKV